jgi:hypothetical protein
MRRSDARTVQVESRSHTGESPEGRIEHEQGEHGVQREGMEEE